MPTCYCPKGARHFQYRPKTTPFPDWAPNADHYPKLKMDGGHLDPWNVRLAHVHCNQVDFAWRGRIRRMLEKDTRMSFEQIAEALTTRVFNRRAERIPGRLRPPERHTSHRSPAMTPRVNAHEPL